MEVRHFRKDGTEIKDISKITIKEKDFPDVYRIIREVVEREAKKQNVG